MKDWIVKMFQEHRWACLCVLGALIVGIMILALGVITMSKRWRSRR